MSYVALRPCKFAGKEYLIGQEIPGDVIDPMAAKRLKNVGKIADAIATVTVSETGQQVEQGEPTFTINIHLDDGMIPLAITNEDAQVIFSVLQAPVKDAEPLVASIKNEDVLMLIHAVDQRKSIKEAAKAQALALSDEKEPDDETPTETHNKGTDGKTAPNAGK